MSKKQWLIPAISGAAAVLGGVVTYIAASKKLADAFAEFHVAIETASGVKPLSRWITASGIGICLISIILSGAIPLWRQHRRKSRIRTGREEAKKLLESAESGRVFRLDPVPPPSSIDEPITFHRADREHLKILNWIRVSRRSLLYVTGFSGCGKSSLMGAFVVPMLVREGITSAPNGGSKTLSVMVRAFGDLSMTLHEVLHQLELDKDPIGDGDNLTPRELLERAGLLLKAQGVRLVLIFDQFEEVLIGDTPEAIAVVPAVALIKKMSEAPIPGVVCVLVARAEYGDKFAPLDLPPRVEGDTWWNVPAFSVAHAAAALRDGLTILRGKKPDNDIIAAALAREAETLGRTPQFVTPIALNMTGFMYESDPAMGYRLAQARTNAIEGLLPTYVRSRIESGNYREAGPAVLKHMVTDAGDRELPAELQSLSVKCEMAEGVVETTLLTLASHGLVRRVGTRWEVSHDFLAPMIRRALDQITGSVWRRIWPWLPFATVSLVVSLLFLSIFWTQMKQHWDKTAFEQCARPQKDGTAIMIRGQLTPAAIAHWQKLPPVDTVMMLVDPSVEDQGLQLLASESRVLSRVTQLFLARAQVTDMGIKQIAHAGSELGVLTVLDLSATRITDGGVIELAGTSTSLTSLIMLDLSDTAVSDAGVKAIARKDTGLSLLRYLVLQNTKITNACVHELARSETGLKMLTDLDLSFTHLTNEGVIEMCRKDTGLKTLTSLNIAGTQITDDGLEELSRPDTGLKGLLTIDLSSTRVTNAGMEGLARANTGLSSITSLSIADTQVTDEGVKALARPSSGIKALFILDLRGTGVTSVGVSIAKDRWPGITVIH